MNDNVRAIFISGATGTGKTSTLNACHEILSEHEIAHAAIEGDYLDMSYPPLWDRDMSLKNLRAVVANYRAENIGSFLYSNTVALRESDHLAPAFGDDARVVNVLLTVDDDTARNRLRNREIDGTDEALFTRQREQATRLAATAPPDTLVIEMTDKSPHSVAREILTRTGWI